jgi:Sulfotransferase domain
MVDFFIVGVQKGGTTALDAYLSLSPHVQMAKVKEIHFFDNEKIDWNKPDYQPLLDQFCWTADSPPCRGEATPIYSYWPNALERLQWHNPRAKLILCLRQPAFRAHSHWRMEARRGSETLSFEQAIADVGRRRVQSSQGGVRRSFSYVERGFYAEQISRMKRLFPPAQLLFLRTDELWNEPMRVVSRVHAFLGVPPPDAVERNYVTPGDTFDLNPVPKKAVLTLNTLYADDIKRTSRLTGIDLDDWLSPDYRDIGDMALTARVGGNKKASSTQRRLTLDADLYATSWRER